MVEEAEEDDEAEEEEEAARAVELVEVDRDAELVDEGLDEVVDFLLVVVLAALAAAWKVAEGFLLVVVEWCFFLFLLLTARHFTARALMLA